MFYPNDILYSREHTWALVDGDTAKIGITDYAQDQMGEIFSIELPEEGGQFSAGDVLCEVESSSSFSEIICPLSGDVIAVNEELIDSPELMNDDPYTNWIVELQLSDTDEIEDLIDADEYEENLEEE